MVLCRWRRPLLCPDDCNHCWLTLLLLLFSLVLLLFAGAIHHLSLDNIHLLIIPHIYFLQNYLFSLIEDFTSAFYGIFSTPQNYAFSLRPPPHLQTTTANTAILSSMLPHIVYLKILLEIHCKVWQRSQHGEGLDRVGVEKKPTPDINDKLLHFLQMQVLFGCLA